MSFDRTGHKVTAVDGTVPSDRPGIEGDSAYRLARRRDLAQARTKLLALAGALADVELRCRLLETGREQVPLLRVWDGRHQQLAETVACLRLTAGWRFTSYPSGPVLADADGIIEPGEAHGAARVISTHLAKADPADL